LAARVMIVDDSAFSRTFLADLLQQQGCEVVGEADSIGPLVETYKQCKPDIVTMDIAMPGEDGFECSRALKLHDPDVKIVIISSMKDEETEAEARQIGVVGYIQKPVEGEILKRVIDGIMSPDELYETLTTWGVEVFKEAFSQTLTRMTKTGAVFTDGNRPDAFLSLGVATVIGITGLYSGSMILDLSEETASKITEIVLRRPPKNREEIIATGAEFTNIVAGIACSMLNNREKALGLRVTPPSVLFGAPTEIANPNINLYVVAANTEFGPVDLSFGFKKEAMLWM